MLLSKAMVLGRRTLELLVAFPGLRELQGSCVVHKVLPCNLTHCPYFLLTELEMSTLLIPEDAHFQTACQDFPIMFLPHSPVLTQSLSSPSRSVMYARLPSSHKLSKSRVVLCSLRHQHNVLHKVVQKMQVKTYAVKQRPGYRHLEKIKL